MKFAHKLIHAGPVHPCYEPVEATQQCIVKCVGAQRNKERNKETRYKLKGCALHWPN